MADRQGVFDYPFTKHETKSSSYEVAHVIPYQGSIRVGAPVAIMAIAGRVDSQPDYDVRVYDVTNATVIAEVLGGIANYPTLTDMGAITNVPEDPAVWEVQIRAAVKKKKVAVASLYMEF